eukprot:CAMPEP_0198611360 /NCGR_PEP_ID=MMETSP1462-20131121/157357_1 /TAXON_ID=1333877 /ORGANISM="Brandtodinium nutriculum, Strain RCC3387" /LENGTH=233 /DNA_ID=CAMNT_0044343165 /DNA_START=157 /DNA_END=856 /DNA_ORIENTATION=-
MALKALETSTRQVHKLQPLPAGGVEDEEVVRLVRDLVRHVVWHGEALGAISRLRRPHRLENVIGVLLRRDDHSQLPAGGKMPLEALDTGPRQIHNLQPLPAGGVKDEKLVRLVRDMIRDIRWHGEALGAISRQQLGGPHVLAEQQHSGAPQFPLVLSIDYDLRREHARDVEAREEIEEDFCEEEFREETGRPPLTAIRDLTSQAQSCNAGGFALAVTAMAAVAFCAAPRSTPW